MESRVVEHVFLFLDGECEKAVEWLCHVGCTDLYAADGEWHMTGPSGIRGGLSRDCDPVTVAAQFGFLLVGMAWPSVFPGLLAAVKKEWQRRRKMGLLLEGT